MHVCSIGLMLQAILVINQIIISWEAFECPELDGGCD